MRQLSTAISDLVLSVSSFYGAGVVIQRYVHASLGLVLIALAAGIGTIRFLNVVAINHRNTVFNLHTRHSWFATILGIPLLAASFSIKYKSSIGSQLHTVSGIAGIMFSIIMPNFKEAFTHFVSTLAILSILFQSFQAKNVLAMAGAILYTVSGTVIGSSGYLMGYHRIDIFHYCLVAANILFVRAL